MDQEGVSLGIGLGLIRSRPDADNQSGPMDPATESGSADTGDMAGSETDALPVRWGDATASSPLQGRSVVDCRTPATVALSDRSVEDRLAQPFGNHLTMVAAHHTASVQW